MADLRPHPGNPRLAPREDVIEQIAAQIDGGMDPAHALIVRPHEGGYQIISGHNRFAAAQRAGLTELPCWVREMSDEEAYMALALNNAQGELSALERGVHALNSGLGVREYASRAGLSPGYVTTMRQGAEVFARANTDADLSDKTRHLAEIHAAPSWLWSALVARLIEKEWSVDVTRKAVKALSDLPEVPEWADAGSFATHMVSGDFLVSDFRKLEGTYERFVAKLGAGEDSNSHTRPRHPKGR